MTRRFLIRKSLRLSTTLSALCVLHLVFLPHAHAGFDHIEWNDLTRQYVKNGYVDYTAFLEDIDKLNYYLKRISDMPIELFAEYSREERIAFWINAFNATVVRVILASYPIESTEEIAHFWDHPVFIAGLDYSLKEVREEIFRKGFRDERATLALVDGTRTSLPLRNEAYHGDRLIKQLTDQIHLFLTDERFNRIKAKKKKLYLSPLFQELAPDFVLGYGQPSTGGRFSAQERAMISFILIHVQDENIMHWLKQERFKIYYLAKDNRLNDAQLAGL